jgi:hypothetical protein
MKYFTIILLFILFNCQTHYVFSQDTDKPVVTCNVSSTLSNKIDQNGIPLGEIHIHATAIDDITDSLQLTFEYKIDLNNDREGIYAGFDLSVGPLTITEYNKGVVPSWSDNPYATENLNPFKASGWYPFGTHRACWYVKDSADNIGICCTLFEGRDVVPPIVKLFDKVDTLIIPSIGCLTIEAKKYNDHSRDNITSAENLIFSFDQLAYKPTYLFCCDELFPIDPCIGGKNISLPIWVLDESGNSTVDTIEIFIWDKFNMCRCVIDAYKVEGYKPLNAYAHLFACGKEIFGFLPGFSTDYKFYDVYGNIFSINCTRNDNPLNGVDIEDIQIIQNHILQIQKISNPHFLAAADVNNSNSITAADIFEIRKLMNGRITNFSKVPSWYIIPKDSVLTNPFLIEEFAKPIPLHFEGKDLTVDFIGIKMGDVNGSAKP